MGCSSAKEENVASSIIRTEEARGEQKAQRALGTLENAIAVPSVAQDIKEIAADIKRVFKTGKLWSKKSQEEIDEEVKQKVDKMWPKWDKDGSGQLGKAEAKEALAAMLNDIEYGLGDMSDEEYDKLFKDMDPSEDEKVGKVEMQKFIKTRVLTLELSV